MIARSVQELQESAPSQEPRKIRVDVADIKERVNRRAAAQEARMVERLRSRQPPPKTVDAPPAAAAAAPALRRSAEMLDKRREFLRGGAEAERRATMGEAARLQASQYKDAVSRRRAEQAETEGRRQEARRDGKSTAPLPAALAPWPLTST